MKNLAEMGSARLERKKRRTKGSKDFSRRIPIGAEPMPRGGVHFRVWAPRREKVSVVFEKRAGRRGESGSLPFSREREGYFSGWVPDASAGMLYRYQLDDGDLFPDPASRFQPRGPEGPSQVIDPSSFKWTDRDWTGVRIEGQAVYELHIGTFTQKGTWRAAVRGLKDLAETGITLLELMPAVEFAGKFGWGYDGVDLYAPYHGYGTPEDFRFFVDQAHALGLGVIMDVVYNHFGSVGSFVQEFSLDYFTDRYETEWGYAINFDGRNSGPVREFFIANAGYWVEEYHLDGLRLDATQSIHDQSSDHVIAAVSRKVHKKAGDRSVVIIAENEPQNTRLLGKIETGGLGVDGVWNDDFHHSATVALTGRNEAYYSNYLGLPQEFISAAKWGYLYQGQYYPWQNQGRGTPALDVKPSSFINYLQNHDQIANSARGERLHLLGHPGKFRALTALWLLIPGTPMFFQGQEFCSSGPFCYFADLQGELARRVRSGRSQFIGQFKSFQDPKAQALLPDPSDPFTFRACKLDHSERKRNRGAYALHRDLLKLRRGDSIFAAQRSDWIHGAVVAPDIFVLRFLGAEKGDRLIVVNIGQDRYLVPAPEPLLAPPADSHWELLWSSEAVEYGGNGTPPMETEGHWLIPGNTALVFAPKKVVRLEYD